MKHVFVGTLHCGEGDFEKCCKMLNAQEGVLIEHLIISNQPEQLAHNMLWSAWRERQQNFDIFVKVDADTVLASKNTLAYIADLMKDDVTGIQAPLYDYFTDGMINGLNCFSNTVVFKSSDNYLYCDRVDTNHNRVLKANDVPTTLVPAGFHCSEATPLQAFHFGLHRMLKNQTSTIEKVRQAYKKYNDKLRLFVLEGAAAAYELGFDKSKKINYADRELRDAFDICVKQHDVDRLS